MQFVSQKGQDKWVIHDIFHYKKNGYFVDLAASDGVTINNTLLLEKELGWNGVCIEPNPAFFNKLQNSRNCIVKSDVIDKVNGSIVQFRTDNGELGGIVDSDTDNNHKIRGRQLKNAIILNLQTKTLESLLDEVNAPKVIDYLSLDIEGAEERVLLGFPFHKYTFLALTIERPTKPLENVLFQNGYVFVRKSRNASGKETFDSFYLHKSIPNFDNIPKEPYSPTPKKNW